MYLSGTEKQLQGKTKEINFFESSVKVTYIFGLRLQRDFLLLQFASLVI